jgi:hypothetical protein
VRRSGVGRSREEEEEDDNNIDGCETNRLSYECDWACASNSALRRFIGRLETNSDKSNSRSERGGDEGSECDEGVKEMS